MKKCVYCGTLEKVHYSKEFKNNICSKHYKQLKKYGYILKRTMFDSNEIEFLDNKILVKCYDRKGQYKDCFITDLNLINFVKSHKWCITNNGYVTTTIKNKKHTFHSLLMEQINSYCVDHIDGNTKNNCLSNLRILTYSENSFNKKTQKNNTTNIAGVCKINKKWKVRIQVDKKTINLGVYENKKEAIYNRYKAEIKYFKKIHRNYKEKINFIKKYESELNK